MSISVAAIDDVTSSSSKEWTNRLQAYTEWLNVQLRKHGKCRKVTDLRHDLQDGVIIAQLVEAIGGECVAGIDLNPYSPAARKENVEKIFQHFTVKKVPTSNCKTKDVLAGDAKCIMRLIHAIASYYCPESVLNPPTTTLSPSKRNTESGHNRCATSLNYNVNKELTSTAKANTSSLGRQKTQTASLSTKKIVGGSAVPIRKPPVPAKDSPKTTSTLSSLSLDNKRSTLRKSFTSLTAERLFKGRGISPVNININGSPPPKEPPPKISCKVAPLQYSKSTAAEDAEVNCSPFQKLRAKKKSLVSRSEPCSLDTVDLKFVEELEELKKTKTCSCSTLNSSVIDILLKDLQEAKDQLIFLQDMLLHGNGGKFVKNTEFCIPYGSAEDTDATTTNQIFPKPSPKEKRNGISETLSMACQDRNDSELDVSKSKIERPETCKKEIKEENESLRKAVEEKDLEIRRLKLALSSHLPGYEKKMKYPYSLATQTQREELQVVHEALTSLRKCFPANDPYQHTLDTIEQSLSALLERVNSLEIGAIPAQSPPLATDAVPSLARRSNYESHNDDLRPFPKCSGFSVQKQEDAKNSTKVVYYMDKSVTPFRCILNKRIGEATLRHFKLLFDRPGQYRYHFKTLDPEFGMVKEEVLNDDDLLPGWDGKIIAWIEEDCS